MSYSYGQSGVENRYYDIFIRETGASVANLTSWEADGSDINTGYKESWSETDVDAQKWCKIGVNEANPTITTSDGDTVDLNTQDTIVLSKSVEVSFNVLNASKANLQELQGLDQVDYDVDILFVERSNTAGATVKGIVASSVNLSVNFEFDTLQKAMCSASKAHARKQNGFDLIDVTYAS